VPPRAPPPPLLLPPPLAPPPPRLYADPLPYFAIEESKCAEAAARDIFGIFGALRADEGGARNWRADSASAGVPALETAGFSVR
jgi:hypothetical protein